MPLKPGKSDGASAKVRREPMSSKRVWLFRILGFLLPLLLLVLAEVGLRVFGYGYAVSFLLIEKHNGRNYFIENPRFGFRFFPAAVARSPLPLRVEVEKPGNTVRVLVLGESAAMGDPEPAYGFPRHLERLLTAKHPDRKFEVINAAMTGINSHVFRAIAEDCVPLQADVWIIYAGNNEVIGPFGAGTVFGKQGASIAAVRAQLLWRATRLGQLVETVLKRSGQPEQWEGMELFLNQQVTPNDARLQHAYSAYSQNLEAVLQAAMDSGAQALFCTMPVNLKDCPPFASQDPHEVSAEQKTGWEKNVQDGQHAERRGHYQQAIAAYERAMDLDPGHAELMFRIARCELERKNSAKSLTYFEKARDLDTLRFRADSQLNHVVRDLASKHDLPLVDAEQELSCQAAKGIAGDDLFYDHVHLNFRGNYHVAAILLRFVERAIGCSSNCNIELPKLEDLTRSLAYTVFDEHRVGEEMRMRLRQPPFTFQSNWQERDRRWEKALEEGAGNLQQSAAIYELAVTAAPKDWMLRANFAHLLGASGQLSKAAEQWHATAELMPHVPDPWFQLGDLGYSAQNLSEAAEMFTEALKRKRESTEALNGLGLVASAQGDEARARDYFKAALRINPHFSSARINLALQLGKHGDDTGAAAQYQQVLSYDTNSIAARLNFGKLLCRQGKADKAVILYKEALAISPKDAMVHYALGNAFSSTGRYSEALDHYSAAVKFSPEFPEAQYNCAMELVRADKLDQALPHFSAAVRLRPDFVDAGFNYGIALAKVGKYQEAAMRFQEVLRLHPNHSGARSALQRAVQLSAGRP